MRLSAFSALKLFPFVITLASIAAAPAMAQSTGATAPEASGQGLVSTSRAVLFDEDPSDPKGRKYIGSVAWRTEALNQGAADDVAVYADVDIPDRKFKMTLAFRRNLDKSLPASHTIDLTFATPPGYINGGVGNMPGILMKSNELARGTPLAGLAVRVSDGIFLFGLSDVAADRARNMQLLQEKTWLDIPLVYFNQRRAILAIEKGAEGEQAFLRALDKASSPELRSNYLVQVSSETSETNALASFRVLQEKFPELLEKKEITIKRVEMGERQAYYRVLVGPFSGQDAAFQFCSRLILAGGDCLVQGN